MTFVLCWRTVVLSFSHLLLVSGSLRFQPTIPGRKVLEKLRKLPVSERTFPAPLQNKIRDLDSLLESEEEEMSSGGGMSVLSVLLAYLVELSPFVCESDVRSPLL